MRYGKKLLLGLKGHLFSNFTLCLSVFILSLIVFFAGYLHQAYKTFYNKVISADGFSAAVEAAAEIPDNVLQELASMQEVIGYNTEVVQTVRCMPADFKNAAYDKSNDYMIDVMPKTDEITLSADLNTQWNRFFVNGSLELTSGSWPESGTNQVVVAENLIRKNGLQQGDIICISNADRTKEYKLKICGIYHANKAPTEAITAAGKNIEVPSSSSYIFCGETIWEQISGRELSKSIINLFAENEQKLDRLIEKANLQLGSEYTIYNNVRMRILDHYSLFYTLRFFIKGSFILIGIISSLILGLQLLYWMQGQYLEAGIYLALGMSERSVKCFLTGRLMILTGAALFLSSAVSVILKRCIGKEIVEAVFNLPTMPDIGRYTADLFRVQGNVWIVEYNFLFLLYFLILSCIILNLLFKNSVKKLLEK